MFPLFETIKFAEGIPQHLEYHQRRLEYSSRIYFNKDVSFDKLSNIIKPQNELNGIYKCKFEYNSESFKISYAAYKPKTIQNLKLVHEDSINYSFKYSNRFHLNTLLEKIAEDEIIIIKNGFITDTSISNLCFFDGVKWVTPSTPLLKGTARERLIEQKVIIEMEIREDDIFRFQKVMLINAMLGFDEKKSLAISTIIV